MLRTARWSESFGMGLLMVAILGWWGYRSVAPTTQTAQTSSAISTESITAINRVIDPDPSPSTDQVALAAAPTPSPSAQIEAGWRVPILMYHYVRTVDANEDPLGFGLSVTSDQFSSQLDYLADHSYRTIDIAALTRDDPLPEKSIILTFDDGYEDFATTAWPVIKAHRMTAVQYVVSGFIGRGGYLSADQIKQLSSGGAIIGAHTVHHLNLTTLGADALWSELAESKSTLEELIGKPVSWFAYPAGRYSAEVLAATKEAGFTLGVTTNYGSATHLDDPLQLPRIRISGGDSLEAFVDKVEGASKP